MPGSLSNLHVSSQAFALCSRVSGLDAFGFGCRDGDRSPVTAHLPIFDRLGFEGFELEREVVNGTTCLHVRGAARLPYAAPRISISKQLAAALHLFFSR